MGTALPWPVPKVPNVPGLLSCTGGTWGQPPPAALPRGPCSSLVSRSYRLVWGHEDSPVLSQSPRVPVPQISLGTWGQPFSAPLPKVPALSRVPTLHEVHVPHISVGALGQPSPASLPDIPVPQITRAQPCPCSPCVPDCPCPIAQCGDSPAHQGHLHCHCTLTQVGACASHASRTHPQPPLLHVPTVGWCWDWRNHILVEIRVSGLCRGVPPTLGPPWPLTALPVSPKRRFQPPTSWPALPQTKTWMLGG